MFLVITNLVIYVRNVHCKNTEALLPIYLFIYLFTDVQRSPQNTDDQHCFSLPCLFVLISHHFKVVPEIRTNY